MAAFVDGPVDTGTRHGFEFLHHFFSVRIDGLNRHCLPFLNNEKSSRKIQCLYRLNINIYMFVISLPSRGILPAVLQKDSRLPKAFGIAGMAALRRSVFHERSSPDQRVPVRRKPLHSLYRQVMGDVIFLPLPRQVYILVRNGLEVFPGVNIIGARHRQPFFTPFL